MPAVAAFALLAAAPAAFADHPSATVVMPEGTGVPGCQETDGCFVPAAAAVGTGGSVTWVNEDSVIHTVLAGDIREDTDAVGFEYPNGFESGLIEPGGGTFTVTGLQDGEYPYYCSVHPWMAGVLQVGQPRAERAAPAADDGQDEIQQAEPVMPSADRQPRAERAAPAADDGQDAVTGGGGSIEPADWDWPLPTITMPEGTGVPGCQEADGCFVPAVAKVDAGGSVTWVNKDSVIHMVSAGDLQASTDMVGFDYPNGFQSGIMAPGGMASSTFTVTGLPEGNYPYFCPVHPWMTGLLKVGQPQRVPVPIDDRKDAVGGDIITYEHAEFTISRLGWDAKVGDGTLVDFYNGDPWTARASVSYEADPNFSLIMELWGYERDCAHQCQNFEWFSLERKIIDGKTSYVVEAEYDLQYPDSQTRPMSMISAIVVDRHGAWTVFAEADRDVYRDNEGRLREMIQSFNAKL